MERFINVVIRNNDMFKRNNERFITEKDVEKMIYDAKKEVVTEIINYVNKRDVQASGIAKMGAAFTNLAGKISKELDDDKEKGGVVVLK